MRSSARPKHFIQTYLVYYHAKFIFHFGLICNMISKRGKGLHIINTGVRGHSLAKSKATGGPHHVSVVSHILCIYMSA